MNWRKRLSQNQPLNLQRRRDKELAKKIEAFGKALSKTVKDSKPNGEK